MADTHEATIIRVVAAPRDRVRQAVTEPEHVAAWFGTPPYTAPVSRRPIEQGVDGLSDRPAERLAQW